MREAYPAYQSRTQDEFRRLWDEAIFAFDTSALLDLYRISERSRDNYLQTMESMQNRVWLPHQVGLEFYANRSEVLDAGLQAFSKIPEFAKKAANDFRVALQVYENYHWIPAKGIVEVFDRAAKRVSRALAKVPPKWRKLQHDDPIESRLVSIFKERIGKPYTDMDAVYVRAERRVALRVPPGFKERKEDYRKYGDVIIWLQLLDYAKDNKKPILWVTRDNKEDWWLRDSGKVVGPRPELVQEMHVAAAVAFHMYSPDQFLKHAATLLKGKASSELKETAQELQQVAKEEARESVIAPVQMGSSIFPGRRVFVQFRCPQCENPYIIVWEMGVTSSDNTLFALTCPRCSKAWQAAASEGRFMGFAPS